MAGKTSPCKILYRSDSYGIAAEEAAIGEAIVLLRLKYEE